MKHGRGRLILAAALFFALMTAPAWSADADGKKAFLKQKCDKCHSVATEGIEHTATSEKMWGPDLSGVGLTRDAEWLPRFVLKEVEIDGKKHKNTFKGSRRELAAIVAWLEARTVASEPE